MSFRRRPESTGFSSVTDSGLRRNDAEAIVRRIHEMAKFAERQCVVLSRADALAPVITGYTLMVGLNPG